MPFTLSATAPRADAVTYTSASMMCATTGILTGAAPQVADVRIHASFVLASGANDKP
jgi:hypothetical protein